MGFYSYINWIKLVVLQDGDGNSNDNPVTVKKEEDDSKKDPVDDLFSAHDFDITIDLGVSGQNSAANVNLKPVTNIKPSTGPKKSLNLADYKKKRGLI